MTANTVISIFVGFLGIIGAIVITAFAFSIIKKPLSNFLTHILKDQIIADYGVNFTLLILGIEGLKSALGYITQPNLADLLSGLTQLLSRIIDGIQWVVYISALLFIGYAILSNKVHSQKTD